jgi:hypothetical protein
MSVLSEKLTGDRLSAYKECYPFNPPELTGSDPVSSGGLGGLDEKAAHDFSPHFILISPATHAKIPQAITARGTLAVLARPG